MNVLSMQGYGAYVWSSVGLTVVILSGNAWYAWRQLRHLQQTVKENTL